MQQGIHALRWGSAYGVAHGEGGATVGGDGNGEEPCGRCDSCRIRSQALHDAGVPHLANH